MPNLIRRLPALPATLLTLALAFAPACAKAADTAVPAATPAQTLQQLGDQLAEVKSALDKAQQGKPGSTTLADLRTRALQVQDQAQQLSDGLAPQMSALQAQITVLGPAPAKGAPPEAPEVAAQRRQLDKAQANLNAQIVQAKSLSLDAQQLVGQITGLRNDQFQARLAERTGTPLGRAFWADQAHAFPGDAARLHRFVASWAEGWSDAWQPPNRMPLLLCLFAAVALVAGSGAVVRRMWRAVATRWLPDGHLRRSATAMFTALSTTLVIGFAAKLVQLGIDWNGTLDAELDALATSMMHVVTFSALMAGLGSALLSSRHASWRLLPLSDIAAQRLQRFPWLLGGAALLTGAIERVIRNTGASLPATVLWHALLALLISGLIGSLLLRLRHARREADALGDELPRRPLWMGLVSFAVVLGVAVCWLAVFTGFIALAFFVAAQMLWAGLALACLYLLMQLARDLFDTLLSPQGRSGQHLQAGFDISPETLEQASAVLTGVTRVLLALVALAMVLSPYDAGPGELAQRAAQLFSGHSLGQLPISPGAILGAIAVFVLGLLALRALKNWLRDQLLPTTSMDPGMRDSVLTLLGYLGGVIVFALSLAEMNVSLQSITWIASALSVGIGFGLQAVVQNFISGLILLVERPVKVGDWVSLSSDVEGDIRRINVRATEIQLWDRSTVIVPNSQLITQNVRNVTHGSAQGRVRILLPMPLDTDADQARQLMLEALQAHPATLANPAPLVRLDNINASSMTFSMTSYVRSPRDVGAVKSDILFDILARLRAASLPLSTPTSMVVRNLGPLGEDSPAAPFQPS
ncbi:MAG: mechanosensitive ion channel family protein [Xanthomonadaceae bacterium]|nr:mechanosensitive ion channel family protein [Xanthomonadaceae bacterium]